MKIFLLKNFILFPIFIGAISCGVHAQLRDSSRITIENAKQRIFFSDSIQLFNKYTNQKKEILSDSYQTWKLHFLMKLFPNPANIFTKVQLFPTLIILGIDIYGILGNKVVCPIDYGPGKNECTINTSSLTDGVYFIGITEQFERIGLPVIVNHHH